MDRQPPRPSSSSTPSSIVPARAARDASPGPRCSARSIVALALLAASLVGLVGCDHVTKIAAERTLETGGPRELVRGVLELRYVQNHDTAFNLFHAINSPTKTALLTVVSSLVLVALAITWWRRRARATRLEHLAFLLVTAGAIGNVADRIRRGFVVDFIHVEHWPVFNIADVLIVFGAGLFGLVSLISSRTKKHATSI